MPSVELEITAADFLFIHPAQLEAMEVDLRILLGEIEDSPFVVQEREKTV